ncbi:NAD(P)-dependent oxidoreductase [Candidatus Albibeggiatoa sp. nov. NOAA]|uniref:NAD(P)-dependent oxidoreductase n=1 Tax=Candidatus Albibeggiatoa sp. nov. NOAA TaxID=3162724 RepID=UPI0032F70640|nr:NAD(P)-dependent oxidoreductase [Thiotrichaceae bacterium]
MKVALLGTGLLGAAMVKRFHVQNVDITAWNRSQDKLKPLQEAGIKTTETALEAIEQTNVIILMLTDMQAIQTVLLESEPVKTALKNKTIIQMGTIAPQQSRELAQALAQLDTDYLEAPVLGSIPNVNAGKLVSIVGSSEAQYEQFKPLLSELGSQVHYVGEVGSAATVKLAFNHFIASLATTFGLSLAMVKANGLDVEQFMGILRDSALYAPTYDKKLNNMLERQFDNPNFPTSHMLKDINLFLDETQKLALNGAATEGVRDILQQAVEMGFGEHDYSALFQAISPEKS